MARHIRWYVNVGKWKPTREEWLKLSSCITCEELTRINRYVYQEDSKSSLVGLALIIKFVAQVIQKPSSDLRIVRTLHGRPEVCKKYRDQLGRLWPKVLDFNVSHSGDYCVFVGLWSYEDCPDVSVGVDVTKIVKKKTKQDLDRFLDLMSRREFSPSEWQTVKEALNDRQKCVNFTRLWCLKESFIKSIGLGLSFKLSRIQFIFSQSNISTERLKGKFINDTKVMVDNGIANNWKFLETALDNEHLVAVGYKAKDYHFYEDGCVDENNFEEIPIKILVEGLVPMIDANEDNWSKFSAKHSKSY